MTDRPPDGAIVAGSALLRIFPDLRELSGGKLRAALSRDLRSLGSDLGSIGRTLTAGVTLPIVGLGAAALKMASDWETAFAGVRKTLDATPAELAAIEQGLRDMAKEIPTSAEELAAIAEAAGAMGIAKEDVLSFTRVVADMAETTNLTSDQAATAFGQIGNVLKLSGEDFGRLGATIVDLGNKGASTESEIVDMILRIAGTGATIGLTADQIAGLAASMANAGINAEAGGTAMSRVLQKINEQVANSGPKLAGFAKVAGMSTEEFASAFREKPAEAVESFLEGLRSIQGEGGNVIGTLDLLGISEARQIDTLTRLANSQKTVAETLDIAKNAWRENNALTAEAEKRYATTAAKFDVFKNTAKDAFITLGNALLPVLQDLLVAAKPIIDFMARLFESFGRLPGPVKLAIVAILGVIAAIGPLLIIIGSLISAIGSIVAVAPVIGAVLGAVFSPFILVIAAVVAAVVGLTILIIKNWDTIKRWTLTVWNAIVEFFKRFWPLILGVFTGGIGLVIALVIKNWDKIKQWTTTVFNAVKDFLKKWWPLLLAVFTGGLVPLVLLIVKNWDKVKAVTAAVWNAITGVVRGAVNTVRETVSSIVGWITGAWSKAMDTLGNAARIAWDNVVGIFRGAWDKIKGIVDAVTGALSKLAFWRDSPSLLEINAKDTVDGILGEFGRLKARMPTIDTKIRVPSSVRGTALETVSGSAAGVGMDGSIERLLREIGIGIDRLGNQDVVIKLNRDELARAVRKEAAYEGRGAK